MTPTHVKPSVLIGLNAGIAFFVLVTLIFNAQQWRADWQLTHAIVTPLSLPTLNQSAALIESIPSLHVFGKSLATVSDVPISSLELRVTGIAKSTSSGTTASKAYISISNQPSKIFHVGDSISSSVKLYDVVDDAIVLENKGQFEKIPLVRNKLEFKPRPVKGNN